MVWCIAAYLASMQKVSSAPPLQVLHVLTTLCAIVQIGVSHLRYACNSARLSEDARHWRYWRHQISCKGNHRALVALRRQQLLNSWDTEALHNAGDRTDSCMRLPIAAGRPMCQATQNAGAK